MNFVVTYFTLKELLEFSKTGRNDPCPCHSGKKYKKCHKNEIDKEVQIRRKQIKYFPL